MKKSKLAIFLLTILLSGCNNSNESTTTSLDSSTSFIENSYSVESSSVENEIQIPNNSLNEFESYADLNSLNNYSGLTPSKGDVKILLLPIHFKDIDENKMNIDLIDKAFNSKDNSLVEWHSVSEFYQKSSYGNLNLSFELAPSYVASEKSTFYTNAYNNNNYTSAAESIIVEALESLDDFYDFSEYDSNNDGYIDGIYLIYDAPVDYTYNHSLWWAWTSYNFNDSFKIDNISFKSYVFAGYDFINQDNRNCNTHTYIHETAHMFGIDDYYDYSLTSGTNTGGLAKADLMDGTIGDHNAFSKALLGWNKGKVVEIKETNTSFTVSLDAFQNSGDYLILANNFDYSKGLLQEYFILEYYTPTNLNEFDKMFSINGIRVLHIVGTTVKNGKFRYNNGTTPVKLISQITTSIGGTYVNSSTNRSDDTLFVEHESLEKAKYSSNEDLNYSFKVDSLNEYNAIITITKTK